MENNFVTFLEAMKASKEGYIVRYYNEDGCFNSVFDYNYPVNENGIELYSFKELLEGTWVVMGKGGLK